MLIYCKKCNAIHKSYIITKCQDYSIDVDITTNKAIDKMYVSGLYDTYYKCSQCGSRLEGFKQKGFTLEILPCSEGIPNKIKNLFNIYPCGIYLEECDAKELLDIHTLMKKMKN